MHRSSDTDFYANAHEYVDWMHICTNVKQCSA